MLVFFFKIPLISSPLLYRQIFKTMEQIRVFIDKLIKSTENNKNIKRGQWIPERLQKHLLTNKCNLFIRNRGTGAYLQEANLHSREVA